MAPPPLAPTALLVPGAPELAPDTDLARARGLLHAYAPATAAQRDQRARILAFLDEHHEDGHLRACRPGHLTASCLLLHADGQRALFTHHAKLDRWLQPGGHCDGDANLPGAALREAIEESGIPDLRIDPRPLDLDVHGIPARADEPAHLHHDTRFLVLAPPGARYVVSEESHDLAWMTLDEVRWHGADQSVLRLFRAALARAGTS